MGLKVLFCCGCLLVIYICSMGRVRSDRRIRGGRLRRRGSERPADALDDAFGRSHGVGACEEDLDGVRLCRGR